MASMSSLGIRTPTALSYLIAEGLLPRVPKPDEDYQWKTYVSVIDGADIEEEVLATKRAVVWSRGPSIRNVFRYDIEGEDVTHALLTTFPTTPPPAGSIDHDHTADRDGAGDLDSSGGQGESSPARALVVALKSKLHIHFLQGLKHILDTPFEIKQLFAAPKGIIIQRKPTLPSSTLPSPLQMKAPPNSFLSPQPWQSSQSFLLSPTIQRNQTAKIQAETGSLTSDARLEMLFNDLIVTPSRQDEDNDLTSLYSLTDPLSEFGIVATATRKDHQRMSNKHRSQPTLEFNELDPAETILYCSHRDELSSDDLQQRGMLYILVTANHELGTLSVWHMWYLEEKTLRSLLKRREEHKDSQLRRRSSFLFSNIGTGTTTPATRHADGGRESFAAGVRPAGDLRRSLREASKKANRKQEEEEAMALQMDPDFPASQSQPNARESRRISSMTSDARNTQDRIGASFTGHGSRRYTSFGGQAERRSLGHRKSRGSTPGSVFSRSVGLDEESMDLDQTLESDIDGDDESIVRNIRATLEAVDPENVFGSSHDILKKEVVVRKVCSFPFHETSVEVSGHDICTLSSSDEQSSLRVDKLHIYWLNKSGRDVRRTELVVTHYPVWPELNDSPFVAVPSFVAESHYTKSDAMVELRDGKLGGLILANTGIVFHPEDRPYIPPAGILDRVYSPYQMLMTEDDQVKESGRNRVIDLSTQALSLNHSGAHGSFDAISVSKVHYRRMLKMRPQSPQVDALITVCEAILPHQQQISLRRRWCEASDWLRKTGHILQGTASSSDLVAVIAALFVHVIDILDSKARAVLKMTTSTLR